MTNPIVRAVNLGKRYRLGEFEPFNTLRDSIARRATRSAKVLRSALSRQSGPAWDPRPNDHIWALKDVSFDIERGEVVGIIGPNGAGKTTLLKILSRITEPTEGWAEIRGRVGSLLDIGTGFHYELTGRENVLLNGAILGMKKDEIDRNFNEIVDFSELHRFIDTPIKRYSDGMRVRLGFAVAAHLEPEILLVDEVLAVGDLAFQRKSLGKMKDVASEGRTVFFVSHNMASIQNLCDTVYLLNQGRIVASGDPDDVIATYLQSVNRVPPLPLGTRMDRQGDGRLRIIELTMEGASGTQDVVQCGSRISMRLGYAGTPPLRNVEMYLYFYNQAGEVVFSVSNPVAGRLFDELPARGTFVCHFERLPLVPGIYNLHFVCWVNGVVADLLPNAFSFHVIEGDFFGSGRLPQKGEGSVAVEHDWELAS